MKDRENTKTDALKWAIQQAWGGRANPGLVEAIADHVLVWHDAEVAKAILAERENPHVPLDVAEALSEGHPHHDCGDQT